MCVHTYTSLQFLLCQHLCTYMGSTCHLPVILCICAYEHVCECKYGVFDVACLCLPQSVAAMEEATVSRLWMRTGPGCTTVTAVVPTMVNAASTVRWSAHSIKDVMGAVFKYKLILVIGRLYPETCVHQLWMWTYIFALKKARASGRNVGKVFNRVLKLVFENYPFSCLSQLRSPHFIREHTVLSHHSNEPLRTIMQFCVWSQVVDGNVFTTHHP